MATGDSTKQPGASSAAFRSRDFRLYQTARLLVILGAEAQSVAVAWQVYQITHSALSLGYTGLALFLPGLFFMLPAGHVADRYDKRTVILLCYTLQAFATAVLLYISLHPVHSIAPIYAVLFLIGMGRCFSGPAASAMLPSLVPKGDFVNAVTWGATVYQTANSVGPMVGGLLFTATIAALGKWQGAPIVYVFTLTMLTGFLILVGAIKSRPVTMIKKAFDVRTMLAGLKYVAQTRLLLGSISLDLFAVLLGGAVALLPIFANDVLHAGPRGLGLLRAMPGLGALGVSLLLVFKPIQRRAGRDHDGVRRHLRCGDGGVWVEPLDLGQHGGVAAGGRERYGERRRPLERVAAGDTRRNARSRECRELVVHRRVE